MKLYHFPSPNPQKVHFALLELGLECEIVPVDLTKGEHRKPDFLALNPYGRVRCRSDCGLATPLVHARERAPLTFLRADDDLGSGDKGTPELFRLLRLRWCVVRRRIDTIAGG